MKKRIILASGDTLGCGFYRCAMPYRNLAHTYGFDVLLVNNLAMDLNPERDVLLLQRQHSDNIFAIAKNFSDNGGKTIFELDDYFHELPPNNPARKAYPKGGKELANMEKFMEMSDLMTVSTPDLARNYQKWAKNIKVCYNVVDLKEFPELNTQKDENVIRIGWAGSATHMDDLLTIIKPIEQIMREYSNVHFVFVGMDYRNLFPFDLRNRMSYMGHTFPIKNGKALFYSEDGTNPVVEYYKLLQNANLDIAIAPLLGVIFNKCKSYIKLIEYSICKIPYVASDFGPYSQFVGPSSWYNKENAVGLLAASNSEWKRNLKALIENKSLREKIGQNAYDNVVKNHTIETGMKNWIDALASIGVTPSEDLEKLPGSYEENIIKSF